MRGRHIEIFSILINVGNLRGSGLRTIFSEFNTAPRNIPSAPSAFHQDVAVEALTGLLKNRKTLSPKLFYDSEGCRLFQKITALPEYYLTRTERQLLETVAPVFTRSISPGTVLVEYGASDEGKAESLLRQRYGNDEPIFDTYVPIDIAVGGLEQIRARLSRSNSQLRVYTIQTDFLRPFALPHILAGKLKFGFFPGSTIGNFEPAHARTLMSQIRETLGRGAHLLVGVDLRKDPDILLPAYNDSAGITAAFNRNILVRLNREAMADFNLADFSHVATWNGTESRIEMHLVSRRSQVVHVAGTQIVFSAGETIHTENSYKYTTERFLTLAALSGWDVRETWTDSRNLFSLHLLRTAG
jgi:dimethylhistidine N-methyltransferase